MSRKVRTAPPMPDDYVMRAIPKQMASLGDVPISDEALDKFADDRALGKRDSELGIIG